MSLRDHQIVVWNGATAAGTVTLECNCGWKHNDSTSDAALAVYRTHKYANITKG